MTDQPPATPYAQNPYAPNPYAPEQNAPNPYAPEPYTPPAYQPVPTTAPGLVPYSTAGAAYSYAPRTNPLAIASLAVSLGALLVGLLASIAGVILGHIALSQIRRRGEGGRGLAIGGLIAGYVIGGLMLIGLIAYIGFIVWMVNSSGYSGY